MSGKMSRDKGQRAEREFIKILQRVIDEVYDDAEDGPILKRNLMQTGYGGYDIVGLPWLALEIKHCETLNINKWWIQTIQQTNRSARQIPVLAYKQNRKGWRIMLEAIPMMSVRHGSFNVIVTLDQFLNLFEDEVIRRKNATD